MMRTGMCGWTCNKSDYAGGDLNMLVENISASSRRWYLSSQSR